MGFFSSSSTNSSKINWEKLDDVSQIDSIIDSSKSQPVIIFKHSTRCSISRMALKQFENEFSLEGKVTPYFLDLIAHREVSNGISQRFNVMHQSPQLLLIKDGISVYDVSHDAIDANVLSQKIDL